MMKIKAKSRLDLCHPVRVKKIFSAVVTALVISCSTGICGTYYVDTKGSDAGAGTAKEPWKTIQKAADTLAPGDTVIIGPGVYNERVTPGKSGTEKARITYQGQNERGQVVIDGKGIDIEKYGALLTITGKSYLTFDRLEIRNSNGDCIGVSDKTDDAPAIGLEFSHLNIHDAKKGSGITFGNKVEKPAYTHIHDCLVHHNYRSGIGLFCGAGGYYLIERNRLFRNVGVGNYDVIQVGIGDPESAANHVVIRQNLIYDNVSEGESGGADAIDVGGHYKEGTRDFSGHVLIEKNLVFGSGGNLKIGGRRGYCIMRFNVGFGDGCFLTFYKQPYHYDSVYNNTFVATHHGMLFGQDDQKVPPISFDKLQMRNNIFAKQFSYMECTYTRIIDLKAPGSIQSDGNLFSFRLGRNERELSDWRQKNGQDPHAVITRASLEKMFDDVNRLDFHLIPGSPAIDAGVALTTAVTDGEGTEIQVGSANFFQDGYDGLIVADMVKIGDNPPVKIKAVNYEKALISLTSPLKWKKGDAVNLPYCGEAPDCGAYEFDTHEKDSVR